MQISADSRKSVKLLALLSTSVSRSLFPSLSSHTPSRAPQYKRKLKFCHSLSMICFILNKSLNRFVLRLSFYTVYFSIVFRFIHVRFFSTGSLAVID